MIYFKVQNVYIFSVVRSEHVSLDRLKVTSLNNIFEVLKFCGA